MKTYFNTLKDIFAIIVEKGFDKEYTSKIATAYIFEEDEEIEFNDTLFDGFGFLFDFLINLPSEMSNEEFKNLILKLASITSSSPTPVDIKRVLYEKELQEIKSKLDKSLISENIYLEQ